MILIIIGCAITYFSPKVSRADKKIQVYTYSTFASSWGAGPFLKKEFQKETGFDVEFIDVGDGGLLVQRLKLEGPLTPADVVLGVDQFSLKKAESVAEFEKFPLRVEWGDSLPIEERQVNAFNAYSWAPLTLIYRKSDKLALPHTLQDLEALDAKTKLVLFDPTTSEPGYVIFEWMLQKWGEGETKNFIKQIKKNTLAITPSWSAGYGLFQKKQAQLVFSYLTSPVYHWAEEKNEDVQPLYLDEPLPYSVEYVGVLKKSSQKEIAKQFVQFLFSPIAQDIILRKNYMLPTVDGIELPIEFHDLKKVDLVKYSQHPDHDKVLSVWKSVQ